MPEPAENPGRAAARRLEGEPTAGGGDAGGRPTPAAAPARDDRGEESPAPGLPPPDDAAGLAATEVPADPAEADVLASGRASWLERLWLFIRYYWVRVLAQFHELRPRELNLSWVTDSLAVGGSFSDRDVRRLRAAGVTAVLDLRGEATDNEEVLAEHGITFLRLPTPDTHSPSPEHFERGVDWVLEQQDAGRKVFVH